MAASESQLSVPESIRVLAAIFPNVERFCTGVSSGHRSESTTKQIAPFLDALTFFLPTIPNDGRVYAMTLAETEKEIIATIAANNAAHLDTPPPRDYPFSECQQSPEDILKTIWGFMTNLSTMPRHSKASKKIAAEMILYLYRTHTFKIRHRFAKRSKDFERFWKVISTKMNAHETFSSDLGSATTNTGDVANDSVSVHHESLHGGRHSAPGSTGKDEPSAVTAPFSRMSETLKSYLDAAKILYDHHKKFYKTNHIGLLVSPKIPWYKFSQLEKSLSAYDRAYLVDVFHGGKNKFDLLRYINKLQSPMSHVFVIWKFSTSRRFRAFSTLSPRIRKVVNSPTDQDQASTNPTIAQVQASAVSKELAANFLRNADQRPRQDDAEFLEVAIQNRSERTRKKTIPISPPHCECLLVRHHALAHPLDPAPIPYIAVSKLSCLHCGIYLDAYNASSEKTKLSVRGRHNDVIPCFLPTISSEVDSLIAEHMWQSIGTVVTAILDEDIKVLKLRQL